MLVAKDQLERRREGAEEMRGSQFEKKSDDERLTVPINEREPIHLERVSSEVVHDRDVGPSGDLEVLAWREGLGDARVSESEREREREGWMKRRQDEPAGRSCECTRESFGWRGFEGR